MDNGIQLNEIIVNENLEIETNSGETQLLAIFKNKEYSCYTINIKGVNYLMFTDDKIADNLKYINQYIIIVEDNQEKQIKLSFRKFYQQTINNMTVTLVKYIGNLNQKNTIKYYDENYFKNVTKTNFLKDIEMHLYALEKDIEMKNGNNRTRNEDQCRNCCLPCMISLICIIILLILCAIFPGFADFLDKLSKNSNNSNQNYYN